MVLSNKHPPPQIFNQYWFLVIWKTTVSKHSVVLNNLLPGVFPCRSCQFNKPNFVNKRELGLSYYLQILGLLTMFSIAQKTRIITQVILEFVPRANLKVHFFPQICTQNKKWGYFQKWDFGYVLLVAVFIRLLNFIISVLN